jgi:PAS domain S-box-containing protein
MFLSLRRRDLPKAFDRCDDGTVLIPEPSLRERGATEYASRAYLEAALDCVVIADLSGRVVEFNPAAERTFGYTREQALGRTLGELIVPPSLRERHTRAFARFAATREETIFGRRVELTGMRADGSEFPVELTLTRVEGEPLLVCGALRDISEAKRAREDLRRLAEEQAALHRVATLVAREAGPEDVFAAVAEEARRVLGLPMIEMSRYEDDGTASVIGASGDHPFQAGTRWPLDGPTISSLVLEHGRPARIDDFSDIAGTIASAAREAGICSAVGVPIFVDRRLWGLMATGAPEPLPADTEVRLGDFTELIGTAISNTQARNDLRALADEQSALRRAATLVAKAAQPGEIFAAVAKDIAGLLDVPLVSVVRYESDGTAAQVGAWGRENPFPVGTRWRLDERSVSGLVWTTGRPARVEDYADVPGDVAAGLRQVGIRSAVGTPIVVDGSVWGVIMALSYKGRGLPDGVEARLTSFTELVATAISNASTRAELVASRARIVTAGDEARRRLERDLHDGTQQRLVALGLDLQGVRAIVPPEHEHAHTRLDEVAREIEAVLEDVRELSRGLHPALLSQRGLRPSLRSLARKSPIEVDLRVDIAQRPAETIEVAVYYVASEALTNAAKHSHASRISITVATSGAMLRATIEDDGIGGAEASAGSGLVGLIDRVEALGGRFALDSPQGEGTTITIELPLAAQPIADVARRPEPAPTTADSSGPPYTEALQVADASTVLAAVAAAPDALYVVDAQGRIRFLNAAALRILGYEDERQLLGRPSHDTIHYLRADGTPFPAVECPLLRPRTTGEAVRVDDDWFVRQDGTLVPVAYSSAPIALSDGRGAVVSFRDMSDPRPKEAPTPAT